MATPTSNKAAWGQLIDNNEQEQVGEVQASPTQYTVLGRLKAIVDALAAGIDIDNSNLDIALSALRDALAGSGAGAKTLADVVAALANVTVSPVFTTLTTVACGELAGATSATQMPSVACKLVNFKARGDNAGYVYIGGSGVTKPDGSTDVTTGIELAAGEETGWLPVDNLSRLYRIADNAGDDLTYVALA